MGLKSTKGLKLECFKLTTNNLFNKHNEHVVNLCSKTVLVFYLTQGLYVYATISMLKPLDGRLLLFLQCQKTPL